MLPFLRFARPHTIAGTTVSVLGLYGIALAGGAAGRVDVLLLTLLSCLAANVYIVGLNQLTDVEIDRVNKPYLPLAAGDFSLATGRAIVLVALALSLILAAGQGRYLLLTVAAGTLIGTVYSLPPLRLKRFHFGAAACIFTVRGIIVNLFLFLHFSLALGGSEVVPARVWALTSFVLGLSLVIAWFKDIPDVDGDRRFQISTLTVRLGPHRVFGLGRALLTLCYLGLVAAGLLGLPGVNRLWLVTSQILLLLVAWAAGRGVQPTHKAAMSRYYLFIWGLFYVQYLVFPLACLYA
ncbi:MAG: homogentisate phytyltransferase [Chloroflexota bacterium]